MQEDLGPCLEWGGPLGGGGYAKYVWRNKRKFLHVIIMEATDGPIPPGMVVMHRCDNPICYRRSHLELGTQKQNVADAIAKGRMHEHKSKYDPELVAFIRRDIRSSRALGRVLGVPDGTIRGIRRNLRLT